MSKKIKCPDSTHFHVVYEQVGSFGRPSKAILAKTPLEALGIFLPLLNEGWKGSISKIDGHANPEVTLRHYSHLFEEDYKEATMAVDLANQKAVIKAATSDSENLASS